MQVAGIDCGVRTMSLCVLSEQGRPVHWTRTDICRGIAKPTYQQLREGCRRWIAQNREWFDGCAAIALETQMRKKFIALNHFIAGVLDPRAIFVSPRRLCAIYNLPRKRDPKKAATIQLVTEMFPEEFARLSGKMDDLADAALLAHYAFFSGL